MYYVRPGPSGRHQDGMVGLGAAAATHPAIQQVKQDQRPEEDQVEHEHVGEPVNSGQDDDESDRLDPADHRHDPLDRAVWPLRFPDLPLELTFGSHRAALNL